MKPYPHDAVSAPKERPYKVVREINKKMFKLRDPKTGLFWGVSDSKRPRFNTTGKSWNTRGSAMRNWAEYQFHRTRQCDGHPELELTEFEVTITEKKTHRKRDFDFSIAAKVEAVLGTKAGGGYHMTKAGGGYHMTSFLKSLAEKTKFPVAYVVQCEGDDITMPLAVPSSIKFHASLVHSAVFATGPNSHVLIALKSLPDVTYVKMALADIIVAIYDIGEIIARYDVDRRTDEQV